MRAPIEQGSPVLALSAFIITLFLGLSGEAVSGRVLGGGGAFPNLVLIVLYIWSVRRPHYLSPPVLLLAGLAHDLFSGGPLGVWALAYLAAFSIARDREADGSGADFGPVAARFTVLAAIATGAAWAAGSVSTGVPAPVAGLITEAILTILVFAGLGWLFIRRKERTAFF